MPITQIDESLRMIDAEYHGQHGILSTYLIKAKQSMIIDPGPTASSPSIQNKLRKLGIKELTIIAATHIHLDHAGGAWKLLDHYPNAKMYVHPRGAQHMIDPTQLAAAAKQLFGDKVDSYGEIRGIQAERIVGSKDGELLDLNGAQVQVVWTPGHASHHQCYFLPNEKTVILGDAGGRYSAEYQAIMPTTPPPFNPVKATESLDKLIALKPEVVCYGHFGFTDRGVEKLEKHRDQLQLWSKIVEKGLEEGASTEEIYEDIKAKDPLAQRMDNQSGGRQSAFISLRGFTEYFRWLNSSAA